MFGVASLFSAAALLPGAAVFRPPAVAINRASSIRLTADSEVFTPPTVEDRALLARAGPSPVLQPRELIQTMMQCLHSSSWDDPRPYFGFEVALRFLSPSHQCFGFLPRDFFRYLRQPHKQTLINWNEYKWAGDTTILEGEEAYQQLTVCDKEGVCQSVRFMLVRVSPNAEPHSQWAVDAVFVAEPDEEVKPDDQKWLVDTVTSPLPPGEAEDLFAQFDANGDGAISMSEFKDAVARLGIARSEDELRTVVEEVDADRSGVIEYDEFEKLLSMVNERCKLGKLATDVIASKTAWSRQGRRDGDAGAARRSLLVARRGGRHPLLLAHKPRVATRRRVSRSICASRGTQSSLNGTRWTRGGGRGRGGRGVRRHGGAGRVGEERGRRLVDHRQLAAVEAQWAVAHRLAYDQLRVCVGKRACELLKFQVAKKSPSPHQLVHRFSGPSRSSEAPDVF